MAGLFNQLFILLNIRVVREAVLVRARTVQSFGLIVRNSLRILGGPNISRKGAKEQGGKRE